MDLPAPIRVLHPITRLIVGGAQENTMYTAERLDKNRFSTAILSGRQTGSEGSLIEEVRARGIPLTILPELRREVSPINDLRAFTKMTELMRASQYTIVHTHSSKAGILGRFAAHRAGVPLIVHTVHGWSFHDRMSHRVRQAYIWMERRAAAVCDALIVVAGRDIQKGLAEGIGQESQYHLIRSAIPLDEFDPQRWDREAARKYLGLPLEVPVLGNVGRFSEQKNPLDWIRVAQKVAQSIPECHFLLVGDGPLRTEVELLLGQTGLLNQTVLTGLRRDVGVMLAAMDVFLLTSLWEGLPRVIPQALAMRVPVVANRVDGTSEVLEGLESGTLSEPGDLDGLARDCVWLLNDPGTRTDLGERGRQVALQEFDLRRMIFDIETLYTTLLNKRISNLS